MLCEGTQRQATQLGQASQGLYLLHNWVYFLAFVNSLHNSREHSTSCSMHERMCQHAWALQAALAGPSPTTSLFVVPASLDSTLTHAGCGGGCQGAQCMHKASLMRPAMWRRPHLLPSFHLGRLQTALGPYNYPGLTPAPARTA